MTDEFENWIHNGMPLTTHRDAGATEIRIRMQDFAWTIDLLTKERQDVQIQYATHRIWLLLDPLHETNEQERIKIVHTIADRIRDEVRKHIAVMAAGRV